MRNEMISVPRHKLEAMAFGRMEFDEFSQYMEELQALLAKPDPTAGRNKCGVQMVDCPECGHQWDHFFECRNRPDSLDATTSLDDGGPYVSDT